MNFLNTFYPCAPLSPLFYLNDSRLYNLNLHAQKTSFLNLKSNCLELFARKLVMADPRLKTIKIKTGVVKRITKEKQVYEREAEEQKVKVEKLKDAGKDEYDIKKQEEVLGECLMMIPDCKRRLARAFEDLQKILDNEQDLKETEEYAAAVTILEQAKEHLPTAEA